MTKKKIAILFIVALFAVCAILLPACSSSTTLASLYSNWYRRTEYTGIQPNLTDDSGATAQVEEIEYSIDFSAGSNSNYEVEFMDLDGSSLFTKFYAMTYDWENPDPMSDEESAYLYNSEPAGIPDGYRVEDTREIVYVYTTTFEISGRYTFTGKDADGEDGEIFTDRMSSVCYFRSVRDSLQPVFSYQYCRSTSPYEYLPSIPELMYQEVEYEATTYYNYDGTECTIFYTDLTATDDDTSDEDAEDIAHRTTVVDISSPDYTVYDNASIYIVMRGVNFYSASTIYADVLIPVEGRYSTYEIYGGISSVELGEDVTDETEKEQTDQMLNALRNAGYIGASESIYYSGASLTYVGGNMSGTSQSVYFAAVGYDDDSNEEGKKDNGCRSTMLRLSMPLSYGLGTLNFNLKKIHSHFDI